MPARTVQSTLSPDGKALADNMRQLAGQADDPIGFVRIKWGAYSAGTRVLTLQVTDRLRKPYAPRSFLSYEIRKGSGDGRWIVTWYVSENNFGTPVDSASAYTKGKLLHNSSGVYRSETDENGAISVTITKGGTYTFVQAGIDQLLRSRGIDWVNAPSDDAPGGSQVNPSTGMGGGGGTAGPGSGDVIISSTGVQVLAKD